jgi:succinate dehydrogenase / fumarate reductase cytochrome b subunit
MKRPLSPHLQIYKPQLTSVLSISHRMTGVALYAGVLLGCFWFMCVAFAPSLAVALTETAFWGGRWVLIVWSACLFYHFYNGWRHLAWDIGKGFDLPSVYFSGYMVVLLTILTTVGFWWSFVF